MTKCQQYFITDPSRSVDFQRQETDPEPETSGESVGVASLREVAFISSKEKEGEVTEEEGDKKKDSWDDIDVHMTICIINNIQTQIKIKKLFSSEWQNQITQPPVKSVPVRDGESGQGGAGAPPPSALCQTKPPAGEEAVKQL